MPMWRSYRLNAQFVFLSSALFLVVVPQGYAGVQTSTQDVQTDFDMAASEETLAGGTGFRVVPPRPTVRTGVPYFSENPGKRDFPAQEERIETQIHEIRSFGNEEPVTEKDGIPLLAETVVEGSVIDQVEGTVEKQAGGEPPAEAVVEDGFVDPFEETVGKQATEEMRDPWESFNASIFDFNYKVDRYVMKPVAKGYNFFIPPDVQNSLGNAFTNMAFAPRFLNNVFQGKFGRAGTETERFLINTTIGIGGLFDVAKYVFNIEAPATEDVGQTLAVSGVNSGPYLILPFLPPTTVRDLVGFVGDTFLNPLNYFIPLIPNFGVNVGQRVNDRSINLETFEGIEETTIDLYGAVRSAYFDRREKQIRE